jgi:hypothetical protein
LLFPVVPFFFFFFLIDYTTTGDFRTPEMPECFPVSSLPVALSLRLAFLLRLRERKSHVEVSAWSKSANHKKTTHEHGKQCLHLGRRASATTSGGGSRSGCRRRYWRCLRRRCRRRLSPISGRDGRSAPPRRTGLLQELTDCGWEGTGRRCRRSRRSSVGGRSGRSAGRWRSRRRRTLSRVRPALSGTACAHAAKVRDETLVRDEVGEQVLHLLGLLETVSRRSGRDGGDGGRRCGCGSCTHHVRRRRRRRGNRRRPAHHHHVRRGGRRRTSKVPAGVGGSASHGRRRTTETSLRMRRRRASVPTRNGRRSSRMLRETRHSREQKGNVSRVDSAREFASNELTLQACPIRTGGRPFHHRAAHRSWRHKLERTPIRIIIKTFQ